MPALFISYRRSDSPDTVKLIHERLKRRLPRWEIFYDHDSIPLGEEFPERLRAKVSEAAVVLVIIGHWGRRRKRWPATAAPWRSARSWPTPTRAMHRRKTT